MGDTKEKILAAALKLFAKSGYEAVSVSMIAGELGITKGALYRHYQNKRDIFLHILSRMEQQDASAAKQYDVPEGTLSEMEEKYQTTSLKQIVLFSRAQLKYWTEDAFAAAFRQMLTLEQYRSDAMHALYQNYLVTGPLDYVTDLLKSLGYANPREEAAALYAPMFFFYSVFDAGRKTEVAEMADWHFEQWHRHLIEKNSNKKEESSHGISKK